MPAFTCGTSAFHMKGGAIKSHATMVVSKLRGVRHSWVDFTCYISLAQARWSEEV
jgi:hypothetical protein